MKIQQKVYIQKRLAYKYMCVFFFADLILSYLAPHVCVPGLCSVYNTKCRWYLYNKKKILNSNYFEL